MGAHRGDHRALSACRIRRGPPRASRIRADAIKSDDAQAPAKKRYSVWTVALSVLLAGGFLWADAQANRAMQTEDGIVLQSLARQLAGKSVYIIDGKYYDQGKIDALAAGKTLLECQFEGSVYGKEPFTKWVDATRGIAGDSNPLSDILHYASDVFDQKNRDSYRADVEARLAECKMQALAFVAQNTALG